MDDRMTKYDFALYLRQRNHELCMDEILHCLDMRNYKNIAFDHIEYRNGIYDFWSTEGDHFQFSKREW